MTDLRCASVSAAQDEPAWATASIVTRWLLVEQPGAWGPEALVESKLPAEVGASLRRWGRRTGTRVLLIRRPDRPPNDRRHAFLVDSARGREAVTVACYDHPAELLDPPRLAAVAGEPWPNPLYLVCTNGRHDPCCARLGRPVLRALLADGRRRDEVWESSHVGGDRFAGNVVALPGGHYFGRLDAETAVRVVNDYEQGRLDLDHLRGRAGDPYAAQAAEYLLRRELGLTGRDDAVPVAFRGMEVDFDTASGERLTVRVGAAPAPEPRNLTCTTPTVLTQPPAYRLIGIHSRDGDGPGLH